MILRRAYDRGIINAGYGIDSDPAMRESAAKTFAGIPGFRFLDPREIAEVIPPASCELAFCTETLEHVQDPAVVLDAICACCRPGARLVITVPIEVGPSLIGKQVGRYLAGLRRPYGYESYRLSELFSAGVLWNPRGFESSHLHDDAVVKAHKGFDFRDVEKQLRKRVAIERTVFSPLPLLGPLLNSTVMWQARVLPANRRA
jgi:SAM-dependent methyltransferase